MSLEQLSSLMLPDLEEEMKRIIGRGERPDLTEFYNMLRYHLGFWDSDANPQPAGKRIRPLLLMIVTQACGADWRNSLPAAAAVELIHNFSLIHDDIEDSSDLRRGRPTVWKRWGIPQAINTGDAMFTMAFLAIHDLSSSLSTAVTVKAAQLLATTCLELTQGQHLDIAYENRDDLSLESYWLMIGGKTAALLSACTEIGALIGSASPKRIQAFRNFGKNLGIAFQAQDDLLGIWGNEALTGKSSASDLLTGKKSLPVLFGLQANGAFAHRWRKGQISFTEVPQLAGLLESEGGRSYTQESVSHFSSQALADLERTQPEREAGEALHQLVHMLLKRNI